MRKLVAQFVVFSGMLIQPVASAWAGINAGPVKLSGDVGYTLRTVSIDNGRDSNSNQLRGSLNANSYIWEPWFATGSLRLTAVKDSSETGGGNGTQTDLFTGNANLNVLPQSKTPLRLHYRASDTRVDRISLQQIPLSFSVTSGSNSEHLGVRQSLLTDSGHRFQLRFDDSHWGTDTGESYDDRILGAEADLKLPKNRLSTRVSQQETENSQINIDDSRFVFNVEHDYVPTMEWRVDSFLNILNEDRNGHNALASGLVSTTDSQQLSSFVFWRPDTRPFTVSGGVRYYGIDSSNDTVSSSQDSLSGSVGGFYQYNKNVRFDGNFAASQIDQKSTTITSTQQRLGALYQSDVIWLGARTPSRSSFTSFFKEALSLGGFKGTASVAEQQEPSGQQVKTWSYQWYSDGGLTNRTSNQSKDVATISAALGHNLNRHWRQSERSTWQLGLSQLLTGSTDTSAAGSVQHLTQSGSLSWNQSVNDGGYSSALMSLSDSRALNDSNDNRQLVNLQLSHNLQLSRQSGLKGSLTGQHVRQERPAFSSASTSSTTASGRLNYHHNQAFWVPQLRFLSDYYISQAELSDSFDRMEWENRLLYVVGLTETQLSYKWIDSGALVYRLFYLRVTRKF